jgi:hypothetical protein
MACVLLHEASMSLPDKSPTCYRQADNQLLGSDIYVGGGFTNVGGVSARAFAKRDGVSWSTWPTTDGLFQYPLTDTPNRMLVKDGSLYIGGLFNQAGGVIANHVVR